MTIQAMIDRVDTLKPNMYPYHQKVAWLSDLDGKVWQEIVQEHEWMPTGISYAGYDQETEPDVELLVPDAYADVYEHYLMAMMDNANRETSEYMKHMMMFNASWQTLIDYWNRKYMPKQVVHQFRL